MLHVFDWGTLMPHNASDCESDSNVVSAGTSKEEKMNVICLAKKSRARILSGVVVIVASCFHAQVTIGGESPNTVRLTQRGLFQDLTRACMSPTSILDQSEYSSAQRSSVLMDLRDDVIHLLRQPDFYGVIGALSAAPSFIEYETNEIHRRWMKSAVADNWLEAGETVGNAIFPFAVSFISYSLGKYYDSPKTMSFASDLFRANVINSLLTVSMKLAINRRRPDGARYGFPSGHTSHAFTTAGVICCHYGPWLGILSEIGATYVGLSRLQENKHYLTDVIGGAILGSYVAYKVTQRRRKDASLHIIPIVQEKTYGACITMQF